jgi:hypothetical protein
MKYFGEEMTPEDIQTVKFINNSFKDKSSYYSFEKPPAEISIVWNIDDWFDWLDRCWKQGDNNELSK